MSPITGPRRARACSVASSTPLLPPRYRPQTARGGPGLNQHRPRQGLLGHVQGQCCPSRYVSICLTKAVESDYCIQAVRSRQPSSSSRYTLIPKANQTPNIRSAAPSKSKASSRRPNYAARSGSMPRRVVPSRGQKR